MVPLVLEVIVGNTTSSPVMGYVALVKNKLAVENSPEELDTFYNWLDKMGWDQQPSLVTWAEIFYPDPLSKPYIEELRFYIEQTLGPYLLNRNSPLREGPLDKPFCWSTSEPLPIIAWHFDDGKGNLPNPSDQNTPTDSIKEEKK